ncbi:MAG: hypothetical protein IRZ06_06900 [Nevskia sp.]|nr:hypothetical protein [Nevskia sp.]
MKLARLSICATVVCLSACGGMDYAGRTATLSYSGNGSVAVGAWDQRPYVLDNDKSPDFVGLQRNLYGIPFNVKTASGRPLADEMGDALAASLLTAAYNAQVVRLAPQDTLASARARLLAQHPRRALLLRIDQWESDTNRNPTVKYDLSLIAFDAAGRTLGTRRVRGEENVEGRFLAPAGLAKQTVPAVFTQKLDQLLNAPQIEAALQ